MSKVLVSNVEKWVTPHLERAFQIDYTEQLKHSNYSSFDPDIPYIIGFEYIGEFTDIGSLGDVLTLAAQSNKLKTIIYLSSYGVYAPKKGQFKESDVVCPKNFVGTRAAILEDILVYLANRYSLDLTILRLFNPYGPYQLSPYVVPTVLERIASSGTVNIGDSEKVRDFFYISDLIDLISLILEKDPKGIDIFNVGSGNPTSISTLITRAQEITGGECDVLFDATKLREEYDYDYAVADINKIKKELGWEPKVSLEEGLALTYQWILGRSGK
ncbi:NAD-dependent epimerase/dehydratase family protein [Mesotoga sp. UBA5847]|uniref:NAD-dependent epimerase/dehydratase family protein n=1 Tax=Mesotoga sp. UBA5847 TaxID=1946859 RepID=UPI0025FD2CC4|nr:GDP-mannose 4,6-dehydratase [Mesotoga sp. UBA5847]